MTATVFLHIGINETGAPGIQHWLAKNQATLLQRGLLYPVTGRTDTSHDLLAEIATPRISEREPENLEIDVSRLLSMRDELRQEISSSGARHVVVSSEGFAWLTDVNPVQDIFRHMQVKVVIFLQRHDIWWESTYRQSIAGLCADNASPAWESGFLPFFQHCRSTAPEMGNFRSLVERWTDAFGKQNIIVHPCTDTPESDNVLSDFLQAAYLTEYASGLDTTPATAPSPMSRYQLQLLEVFLRVRTTPVVRRRLLQHAMTLSSVAQDPYYSHVPLPRRAEFISKSMDSYAFIAREYLGRENGQLFAQPWPSPQEPWEPLRTLTAAECIEESIAALTTADPENTRRPGLLARLLSPD